MKTSTHALSLSGRGMSQPNIKSTSTTVDYKGMRQAWDLLWWQRKLEVDEVDPDDGRAVFAMLDYLESIGEHVDAPSFNPLRGGHAPRYLRVAFDEWVADGGRARNVRVQGRLEPLRWLIGRLWNCTDPLPEVARRALGLTEEATYATGVRRMRRAATSDRTSA
ncbi:MAG: hypothetical protein ABR529_07955 [Actinomycetota bacterium]